MLWEIVRRRPQQHVSDLGQASPHVGPRWPALVNICLKSPKYDPTRPNRDRNRLIVAESTANSTTWSVIVPPTNAPGSIFRDVWLCGASVQRPAVDSACVSNIYISCRRLHRPPREQSWAESCVNGKHVALHRASHRRSFATVIVSMTTWIVTVMAAMIVLLSFFEDSYNDDHAHLADFHRSKSQVASFLSQH